MRLELFRSWRGERGERDCTAVVLMVRIVEGYGVCIEI